MKIVVLLLLYNMLRGLWLLLVSILLLQRFLDRNREIFHLDISE